LEAKRIIHISLDDPALVSRNPDIEHERRVAIFDLLESNFFELKENLPGPYRLLLSLADRALVLSVRTVEDEVLSDIRVSLTPFRRLIKDYFMICESYYEAIRNATPDRIETIDMSRRALHNEGSELLQEKLEPFAELDLETARRLFTLVSVLQMRG
jgi:uncharacterized protein (UPF0262 family)